MSYQGLNFFLSVIKTLSKCSMYVLVYYYHYYCAVIIAVLVCLDFLYCPEAHQFVILTEL